MRCLFILLSMISLPCYADSSLLSLIDLKPSNSKSVVSGGQTVSAYCAEFKNDAYIKCINNKEIQWTLNVFESASLTSKKLGKIIVSVVPQGNASAKFYTVDGKAQDYIPNLVSDEYGNHFDFPILQQKGDWTQLPRNPFPQPVWINAVNDWKETDVTWMLRPIKLDEVYTHTKLGDIVFTKISGDKVTFRQAYEKDFDCGQEGINQKAKEPRGKEVPIKDVLDSDGHLPVFTTQWKGC